MTSRQRSRAAPEVPTFAEVGYKDFEMATWYGMTAPRGLPKRIAILTGNDNFILESFMLGATGALIGFGAVMTREQVDMIDAWNAGRIEDAKALGRRVQRLADVVFAAPVGDYRVRLKECLRILGVLEAAHVRRPLQPLHDEERAFLASVLREVGLLTDAIPTPALTRS